MAARVPSPSENLYDGRGHEFQASAYLGEMEDVGLGTSWGRWEGEAVVDEWCFVRFPENHDVTEGGCEDLGEYPSDRNPLVL